MAATWWDGSEWRVNVIVPKQIPYLDGLGWIWATLNWPPKGGEK